MNTSNPQPLPSTPTTFAQRLWENIEVIIIHSIGMAVTILAIWGFEHLLKYTLGQDAKLFGQLPIIYVSHVGDLLAMLRFAWKLWKEF